MVKTLLRKLSFVRPNMFLFYFTNKNNEIMIGKGRVWETLSIMGLMRFTNSSCYFYLIVLFSLDYRKYKVKHFVPFNESLINILKYCMTLHCKYILVLIRRETHRLETSRYLIDVINTFSTEQSNPRNNQTLETNIN